MRFTAVKNAPDSQLAPPCSYVQTVVSKDEAENTEAYNVHRTCTDVQCSCATRLHKCIVADHQASQCKPVQCPEWKKPHEVEPSLTPRPKWIHTTYRHHPPAHALDICCT